MLLKHFRNLILLLLTFFFLEFLNSAVILSEVSSSTRFRNFLFEESLLWIEILWFFIRVGMSYLLLFGSLYIAGRLLQVKKITLFVFLNLAFMYLLVLIRHPQAFEEFPSFVRYIHRSGFFDSAGVIHRVVIALIFIQPICISFIKTNRMKNFNRQNFYRIGGATGILFVLLFGKDFQTSFKKTWHSAVASVVSEPKSNSEKNYPNIFFVILDSINSDDFKNNRQSFNESLSRIVNQSYEPIQGITPIAQTHASLTSLFTAKLPYETQVRTNLSENSLISDQVLKISAIDEYKRNGYDIHLWQDVEEYSTFSHGNTLIDVKSPSSPILNIIVSTFFRHRLSHFVTRSGMAQFIVPELDSNSSFFFNYDPSDFIQKIDDQLAQLPSKNQLVFIHTCSAHWPGQVPFPYYVTSNLPAAKGNIFSYNNKYFGTRDLAFTPKDWTDRSQRNQILYSANVKFLISDFLNPLINTLDTKFHFLESASASASALSSGPLLAIMSDHGEGIFNRDRVPLKNRYPNHGGSLLFSSRAEQFMSFLFPKALFNGIGSHISIQDLLPYILSLQGCEPLGPNFSKNRFCRPKNESDEVFYSETGIWPMKAFNDQFLLSSLENFSPILGLDRDTKQIFINKSFLPSILVQKQRAAYFEDYRLTYFPTLSGNRYFLCDLKNDILCEKNIYNATRVPVSAKERLVAKLNESFLADRKNNLFLNMDCSVPLDEKSEFDDEFVGQYYYRSLLCLNEDYNLKEYYRISNLILMKSKNSVIRSFVYKGLVEHCAIYNFFNLNEERDIFRETLKQSYRQNVPLDEICRTNLKVEVPKPTPTLNSEFDIISLLNTYKPSQPPTLTKEENAKYLAITKKLGNFQRLSKEDIEFVDWLKRFPPYAESLQDGLYLNEHRMDLLDKKYALTVQMSNQLDSYAEVIPYYWLKASYYRKYDDKKFRDFIGQVLEQNIGFNTFVDFLRLYYYKYHPNGEQIAYAVRNCSVRNHKNCRSELKQFVFGP